MLGFLGEKRRCAKNMTRFRRFCDIINNMLTLVVVNPHDKDALGEFSDFFGVGHTAAVLYDGHRMIGVAAVSFFKDGAKIEKVTLKDGFDGEETRRFFLRSLVFKLCVGNGRIFSSFKDPLLAEIGFEKNGEGMSCLAKNVVFKKMCGD